ncbi:MAG: SDR family oxidoreductase [Spirochaetia bacterium]|nr:SDR family oxidoreductase [Spirochaetia bacterium]
MNLKTYVITGASSGIGKQMALELASSGGRFILTGRDRSKGEKALNEIKQKSRNPEIEMLYTDVSSQKAIQNLAEEIQSRTDSIDVLINNAGSFFPRKKISADGLEMTFAVNHMAYYLLTDLLMDLVLKDKPGKIINTSSKAHFSAKPNLEDLNFETRSYNGWTAYANSKLYNLYFTYYIEETYRDSGLRVNAFHPGVIATDIVRNMFFPVPQLWKIFSKSVKDGAAGGIHLASSPEMEKISGKFFDGTKEKKSSKASYDRNAWRRLMKISEEFKRKKLPE